MLRLDERTAKAVWAAAQDYLGDHVPRAKFEPYLVPPDHSGVKALHGIYKQFLYSLKNRQAMSNAIGPIEPLRRVLFCFDPAKITKHYGDDWKALFRRIRDEVRPPTKMAISEPRSYWVHFCKGALDGAAWLAQFDGMAAFCAFVDRFATDPVAAAALPMMLAEEIHGFGFALGCDFLKESGWSRYAKPDVHTKAILHGLGLCDGGDYATFKAIVRLADLVGETPFAVDKGLWLIGSGWLYDDDERFQTDREQFVRIARARIAAGQ